jgi:hypothetical protein
VHALNRRLLWPAAAAVALAGCVVLGVLLALDLGGGDGFTIRECKVGEPGCTLRQAVHEHANFALFLRGEQYDFHRPEYITTDDEPTNEVVHIHDPRYEVVHVHLSGTTWDEFFRSLGFELRDPTVVGAEEQPACLTLPGGQELCDTEDEKLSFIVNGVKVEGIAFSYVTDLDRVLISYGDEDEAALMEQYLEVDDDACIPSVRCPERIPPGEPEEPCQGEGACTG